MKIIFIRADKIGDLICSLPVDQDPYFSDHQTSWVIAKGLKFITDFSVPKRKALEINLSEKWNSFWSLYSHLRSEKPDMTMIFHGPWWVSLATWLARVPTRAGKVSQWHSFLFLNKGIRQSRSESSQHEADYNFALAKETFHLPAENKTPVLKIHAPVNERIFDYFNLEPQKYFVVHPGMAGSALNWPEKFYSDTIASLVENYPVAITGTPADDKWLEGIKRHWQNHDQVRWLQGKLTAVELLSILTHSRGVVVPSTGVAHIAAACGVRVVGIYSPIQVQSKTRWAPRGENAVALAPDVECPEKFVCAREKCPHYLCLNQILVEDVLKELKLS